MPPLQYVNGNSSFNFDQLIAADISLDGTVSSFDVSLLAQYNVGLINNFNIYPLTSNNRSIYINLITEESHLISFINIMVLLTYLPLLFFPFFLLFKTK